MPTAKKLPSGSWRCQIYSHDEPLFNPDGSPLTDSAGKQKMKKIRKSFTCDIPGPAGKREAERMATEWAAHKNRHTCSCVLTIGEAIDEYITSRESVLSPRTVMDYKRTRKYELKSLMDIRIDRLTQEDVQKAVNADAQIHSPKTVRNNHGLISAVLRQYRPDFILNTSLPQKKKPALYIPTEEEVHRLMKAVRGTEMELPVLLAAFGPMRRGEICALQASNISGNIVHVCENMVYTENKEWIIKQPKSDAGDRYITYPEFITKFFRGKTGRIVNLTPGAITTRFNRILKRENIRHFRFHDLRHYSASIQHAMGIPDAYIMERGGWSSDTVLKNVYRHSLSDMQQKMNDIANTYFNQMYDA